MNARRAIVLLWTSVTLACLACRVVSPPPSPTIAPLSQPAGGHAPTGLHGRTVMGPMCPGPARPGHPCPDKPFRVGIDILDVAGRTVATARSDEQGMFDVTLPAGVYGLVAGSGTPVSLSLHSQPLVVTVHPGEITEVELHFDNGMR